MEPRNSPMRAIHISQPGGPEVLTLVQRPCPKPGPHELLVEVHAAALNRADTLQRSGLYQAPPGFPDILGVELAGVVAAVGDLVQDFHVGAPVMGLVRGGAYADFCLLDERMAMPIPPPLSFVEAAAVPEAFFVANETLFHLGRLTKGQHVLIHAASSGMGTVCVQLAKAAGATVLFTAGSKEKARAIQALGGDVPIFYKETPFADAVLRETKNKGVDLIIDLVGGDSVKANQKALAVEGCIVLVGLLGGYEGTLDVLDMVMRRTRMIGFSMRGRPDQEKHEICQRFLTQWWDRLTDRTVHPVVSAVFPLEAAHKAHELMEANAHLGKIVLNMKNQA